MNSHCLRGKKSVVVFDNKFDFGQSHSATVECHCDSLYFVPLGIIPWDSLSFSSASSPLVLGGFNFFFKSRDWSVPRHVEM